MGRRTRLEQSKAQDERAAGLHLPFSTVPWKDARTRTRELDAPENEVQRNTQNAGAEVLCLQAGARQVGSRRQTRGLNDIRHAYAPIFCASTKGQRESNERTRTA